MQDDLMYDKRWRKKPKYGRVAILLILFAVVLIVVGHDFSYRETMQNCTGCHNRQMSMSQFFKRKGSPDPQRMATAVLETRRPRLMAAIAVRESNGNPKAVGDGGRSRGSFQVQAKHWKPLLHEKKVSKDPVIQALDSERIIDDLIAANNGNLKKALNAYNGDTKKKVYAKNILADLEFIP